MQRVACGVKLGFAIHSSIKRRKFSEDKINYGIAALSAVSQLWVCMESGGVLRAGDHDKLHIQAFSLDHTRKALAFSITEQMIFTNHYFSVVRINRVQMYARVYIIVLPSLEISDNNVTSSGY